MGLETNIRTVAENEHRLSKVKIIGGKFGGGNERNLTFGELKSDFENFRKEVDGGKTYPIRMLLAPYPEEVDYIVKTQMLGLERAVKLLEGYRGVLHEVEAVEREPSDFFVRTESISSVSRKIKIALSRLESDLLKKISLCDKAEKLDVLWVCDFSKFPIVQENALIAQLYKSTCPKKMQPPPLGIVALDTVVKGDGSMGSGDRISVAVQYVGKDSDLIQTVRIRASETITNMPPEKLSWIEGNRVRSIMSEEQKEGCFIKGEFSVGGTNLDDPSQGWVSRPTPNNAHDYAGLIFDTEFIDVAKCTSNVNGDDLGRIGCQEITFKPVEVPLEHIEHKEGNSPPDLMMPTWLLPYVD